MTRYLDPALSPSQPALTELYAHACGLEYDVLGVPLDALTYGDVIITSPFQRAAWTWLPTQCQIELIPDGGEVKRTNKANVNSRT